MWPHERSLVKRLADAPFAVLGVNVNGYDVANLKLAMEKEQMNWRSFADPGEICRGAICTRWNVTTIPTLYLLDAKGIIRRKWVGEADAHAVDAAIDELLAATKAAPAEDE